MHFSGKITHSCIEYLGRHAGSFGGVFHLTDVPEEFLKDPGGWVEADKLEAFLCSVEEEFCSQFPGENLVQKIGHKSEELRSWGVLDSVLRMMKSPEELYNQPDRILSYFISPAPPVGNLFRDTNKVSFDLPIRAQEYPLTVEYLKAALEALPTFMGQGLATVSWSENHVKVDWQNAQESLFAETTEPTLKPEFVDVIIGNIESTQKELADKAEALLAKEQEIKDLEQQIVELKNQASPGFLSKDFKQKIEAPLSQVQSELMRMSDYMSRSQQLITLLIGQGRMNPQVKEAMRRVDWEFVQTHFSRSVEKGVHSLKLAREVLSQAELAGVDSFNSKESEAKVSTDLNELLSSTLDELNVKKQKIQVDKLLFLDRQVSLHPEKMKLALKKVLQSSLDKLTDQGQIRLITRPRGFRAEIEISDTGQGYQSSEIQSNKNLDEASNLIKQHNGNLNVMSRVGEGSTFVIDLPM